MQTSSATDDATHLLVSAARRRRTVRIVQCSLLLLLLLAFPALLLLQFLRVGPFCSDGGAFIGAPPVGGTINLILMRHAQSQNNAKWYRGLCFGLHDPMLTDEGWQQSEAAGRVLAANNLSADLVMSSQLMRAMETASLAFDAPVHVAPHISETGYGCFLSPGSCPLSRPEQQEALERAGFDVASQFDWSLVGGVDGSNDVSPDWPQFVEWLWKQSVVRRLVLERGANATVAIVSHGNFLWHHVLPCPYGHPKNTQAYLAQLVVPQGAESPDASLRNVRTIYYPP